MIVLHILLQLHIIPGWGTGGSTSKWVILETANSEDSGRPKNEVNWMDFGINARKDKNKNKTSTGLDDNDQSCASSADCYKDCKLCDGYGYGFGPAGPAGPAGPEDSFCLCQDGTCNKIEKEKALPDGFKKMEPCRSPPCNPQRNKCILNGKCIKTKTKLQECNGKCIKYGSLCGGQCAYSMCRKGKKCLTFYKEDKKVRKLCNGDCIGLSENCDGKCEDDQCVMDDGSCMTIVRKSQIWKSCNGKCIKSIDKCGAFCSLGQCEKIDGTCAYTTTEPSGRARDTYLKFGICAGDCTEILTKLSTPPCHGRCDPIPGLGNKLKDGICKYHTREEMSW